MTRTHFRHVDLWKWFPPNDPVAACLARLCILREDLWLEHQGLRFEDIKFLDGNQSAWRRIYFFRSILRTLFEIRGTILMLNKQKDFRNVIQKQSKASQKKYKSLFREFEQKHEFLKVLRNKLGGHIDYKAVVESLNSMDADRRGMIEAGTTIKEIHYRFTAELVMAMLFSGVPGNEQIDSAKQMIRKVADLSSRVFPVIDNIIGTYIKDRKLNI